MPASSPGHPRREAHGPRGPEGDGDVVIVGDSMPDDSDYIRMRGHIDRVKSEFAALDPELIERICQNLIVVRRSRPTLKKLRAYVVELTSDHDEPKLRGMLGLPPASRPTRQRRPSRSSEDGVRTTRRRGRPGWTAELFWARYQEALSRATPPHTYRSVAPHFVALDGTAGTSAEYLGKLVRRFGLPPG